MFALTRIDHVTRLINGLHVGSVNVWELPGYRTEVTPFGGIKQSGLGYKERVLEAMRGFTQLKTYSLRGLSRPATGYSIPEN
ncbi:aldehyde dehydrogenase family protein [Bradyrhizobium sp. 164]|uniref:aldehyde dehydrogenase family protein n=1 Tax=Bradyrhizobium sp. 164 TaxID=2782637 RepID=UPI003209C7D4